MPSPDVEGRRTFVQMDLEHSGIAVVDDCNAETAELMARSLGTVRSQWKMLISRPSELSDPWSLSGQYGLGEFPWHTDGAVASRPPRLLTFHCDEASDDAEPTDVLDLANLAYSSMAELLSKIVLRVTDRAGNSRYLPALRHVAGKLTVRWDSRVSAVTDSALAGAIKEQLDVAEPS